MTSKPKKSGGRFPLRVPDDLDEEIRALARGNGSRPPAGINDTLVFVLREGLKALKQQEQTEKKPGNSAALPLAA